MTEQSPRVLEFPSLRLDPIQITEHPGWGNDRIQARIGPYHVWMDATKTVHVADQRIANEEERLAQARTYTLTDAFTFGGGLILDDPETFCSAEQMTEQDRAVAIWAGAYLLIEGSRFMMVEGVEQMG